MLNTYLRKFFIEVIFYKRSEKLGSEGFEPTKDEPADLQSVPFDHSGNSPFNNKSY